MKKTIIQLIREQEKTTVKVDPRDASAMRQAEKLAKMTDSDIDLRKEEQSLDTTNTTVIAKLLKSLLEDALRESGMEISSSQIQNIQEGSFAIEVQHPNEHTELYEFVIENGNKINISSRDYLEGQSKELGEVGVKASGEPVLNSIVVKSNLVDYFTTSPLTVDTDLEFEDDSIQEIQKIKKLYRKVKTLAESNRLSSVHKRKIQNITHYIRTK